MVNPFNNLLFSFLNISTVVEVYYLLYADGYETPSKVAADPEEPCLGRIRADSVAPPHTPTSIKRCISRVEKFPALASADLFENSSCDTPLKDGHISILRTDGPGLSPNDPMAIVQAEVQVEVTSIPDGSYLIKNRAADLYWSAYYLRSVFLPVVYFWDTSMKKARGAKDTQVNKHSTIILVFGEITLFRSGTSHKILMATSL